MDPQTSDHAGLIAALCDNGVEFVVVGGSAAVLLGAPVTTLDVDVVYRRTPENAARLHQALVELAAEARPRIPDRKLVPTHDALENARGPILLSTPQGPLDLLPVLDPVGGYEALLDRSKPIVITGKEVLVIDLDTLIQSKQHANRPKDRLTLPILLALRNRQT